MALDNAGCKYHCNSLGQFLFHGEWRECTIHGKKSGSLLENGELPNGENLYDLLKIPYEYRDNWVKDISRLFLNTGITENCVRDSVVQMKYLMETLYNVIAVDNNMYMESFYLYSNLNLLDWHPYMYTLQRIAFENHMSVLPSITINDLAGLLALQEYSSVTIRDEKDVEYITKLNRLAGQGADWYLRTNLSYTDYMRCSFCFVIDNSCTLESNLRIFNGFLEERSRRGLPTYVFSSTFFDTKRENLFYDRSHRRKLSSLNPYLLLGKGQEFIAREHGWLDNKGSSSEENACSMVTGYNMLDFGSKSSANSFDL